MNDSSIIGKFTIIDRLKNVLNCLKPKEGGVEFINLQSSLFSSVEEVYRDLKNKQFALKLIVKNTGIMEMDENVQHPFVRIHIVDMNTCKYLAKEKSNVPGVSNIENCSLYKIETDKEGK